MEIEGKIILDLPMQEGTSKAGNHWQKKEWVLETINTQYPRKVKFHVFGDRATQLAFEVGKVYTVSFDLESREFNGRWYTDVSCYAARESQGMAPETGGYGQQPAYGQPVQPAYGQPASQMPSSPADSSDDLPF